MRVQRPATIVRVTRVSDVAGRLGGVVGVVDGKWGDTEQAIAECVVELKHAPNMIVHVDARDEVNGATVAFCAWKHLLMYRKHDLGTEPLPPLGWLTGAYAKGEVPSTLMRLDLRIFVGRRLEEREVRAFDPGVRFTF